VRSAIESAGRVTHSMVFIWVESPMAGVLASTYVGFALGEPMTRRMTAPLDTVLIRNAPDTEELRREVDGTVWRARNAVHAQVAAELTVRGPEWEQRKRDVGNHAWDQVWQTIGDPLYSQGWEQDAQRSEGLFESNLEPWADAMMEGQFSAGAMAALDAIHLLDDVDITANARRGSRCPARTSRSSTATAGRSRPKPAPRSGRAANRGRRVPSSAPRVRRR
jgi:hypothetical protein